MKKNDSFDTALRQDSFRWGPILLHNDEVVNHFMAIGATGSGKTTILRLLLQDIVRYVSANKQARLLIYDAKQDVYPMIRGMDRSVQLYTLNPFESRGSSWNLTRDVTEPRVALEIAYTLVPAIHESQPFFSDAARQLLCAVMVSFMHRSLRWSLADIIRATWKRARLRNTLLACPYTQRFVPLYFHDKRLMANILTTIDTKMAHFQALAGSWESATTNVSLEEWVEGNGVLILGNSETSRTSVDAVNRCIFKRVCDLTLNQEESRTRRTFIVIDELAEAGKLQSLVSLLAKGRSKGACCVLALQSIAGLKTQEAYGEHLSSCLLANLGHRWFGRIECPETAEWASRLFGDQEISQLTWSATYGQNYSTTNSEHIVTQKVTLPSQLMSLLPCNEFNGLAGYYLSRVTGAFYATLPGDQLFNADLLPPSDDPGFIPRDPKSQWLRDWTPEEELVFAPQPRKEEQTRPSSQRSILDELDSL